MPAIPNALRALTGGGALCLSALIPLETVGPDTLRPPPALVSVAVNSAAEVRPATPAVAPAAPASQVVSTAAEVSPVAPAAASLEPQVVNAAAEEPSAASAAAPLQAESSAGLAAIAALNAGSAATAPQEPVTAVAYAPPTETAPVRNPLLASPPPIAGDLSGLRAAIGAYHAGNLAQGDDAAHAATDPLARTMLEWVALRLEPRLPFERIAAFLTDHPDWPAADYLRRRAEVALYSDHRAPALITAFFADHPPETVYGKLALARAKLAAGEQADAASLVRDVWLSGELGAPLETSILHEFGSLLSKDDHRARADRLFYTGYTSAERRAAQLAGPEAQALAKARAAPSDAALVAALPAGLRDDPGLLFVRIKKLREQSKFADAAKAMLGAPRDPATLVAPDEWWTEREFLARKVLDQGDAATAYRLCAEATPTTADNKRDAAFEAGWIALRFLHQPALAATHFAVLANLAATPSSQARAAYWQGRAAEAADETEAATAYYRIAADHATTYYGQLARANLGKTDVPIPMPANIALGDDRAEVVRVVELLEALHEGDIARPLAIDAALGLDNEAQLAALAQAVAKAGDARTTLLVGKAATRRGFALDAWAFPVFGIPTFDPLGNSAGEPVVYAIARQESAFAPDAVSSAGAMGLMQMIVSTARRTAARVGVHFEASRLLSDASFNAQLGAAHLGELINENRGSMILTFAAYNAGAKRVKEWIAAYGDPRKPDVDPVDWVERIPFTETRNYVQRVTENLQIYRQRFGDTAPLKIESDLR